MLPAKEKFETPPLLFAVQFVGGVVPVAPVNEGLTKRLLRFTFPGCKFNIPYICKGVVGDIVPMPTLGVNIDPPPQLELLSEGVQALNLTPVSTFVAG